MVPLGEGCCPGGCHPGGVHPSDMPSWGCHPTGGEVLSWRGGAVLEEGAVLEGGANLEGVP